MGLLDFANTDDGMQGLGLLGAAAPMMEPMNLAGRLAMAAKGYQGLKDDALKQQDLAQQIQVRNIGLQQAQQKWALQLPFLQALAGQMGGAQSDSGQAQASPQDAPAQSQPQSMPTMPFASPINMTSGQMPPQPAPTQSQGGSPQTATQSMPQGGNGSIFGIPRNVAVPTIALNGFDKFGELVGKYNEPTELGKQMQSAGIDPSSPQGKAILGKAIAKSIYQAPTRLGEAAYATSDGAIQGLPTAPPQGYINVRDANGNWTTQEVGGGREAVTNSTAAKKYGENTQTLTPSENQVVNKDGTRRVQSIAQTLGAPPNSGFPAGTSVPQQSRNGSIVPGQSDRLSLLQQELATVQSGPKTPSQAGDIAALQRDIQREGGKALTEPQGVGVPFGVTANADAANKASATTMEQSYAKLQASNATSGAAIDSIDRLMELAKNKSIFSGGPLAPSTAGFNQYAAKAEKERANLITLLASQDGTNGSDAGRLLTGQKVPDYGKPVPAQLSGLQTIRNQIVAQQLKTQFLTPNYKDGKSADYTSKEQQFDTNITPELAPVLSMPANKSRGLLLTSMKKDPVTANRLEWAASNGLFK